MSVFEQAPARYPYLISMGPTPPSPPAPVVVEAPVMAELLEDVDMAEDEESGVKYIAIDTNVLLHNLAMIKELYDVLDRMSPPTHNILVATAVVNELDKHKLSSKPSGVTPEGPVTLGDLAVKANHWLLDAHRRRRATGRCVVRGQRWSECLNDKLHKPDDQILDCCLFFQQRTEVVLWTGDRNLSVLSESNDVKSIDGQLRLNHLLRECGIPLPPTSATHAEPRSVPTRVVDDMELDDDLYDDHSSSSDTHPTPCTSPPSSPPQTPQRKAVLRLSTPRQHRPIARSPPVSPQQQLVTFRPLLLALTTILAQAFLTAQPTLPPPNRPIALLDHLKNLFITTEQTVGREGDTHVDLLCAVSAFGTVRSFAEEKSMHGKRRPRTGELADAIVVIADSLLKLQMVNEEGQKEIRAIADGARLL